MNVKKIEEFMQERGMKRTELAKEVGVSEAFITNMLKGFKNPSLEVAKRIANCFNVKIDDLI